MLEMRTVNCNGLQAKMLPAAALFAMLFAGDAFAGDQAPSAKSAERPIAASLFAPPLFSSIPSALPQPSATDFRSRKHGLPEGDFAASEPAVFDAPMLQDTSIAGRMAESKSEDRVRLLTLWQSRASSLSLQAGKHGAPSLQWSTPWMHREGTSHGLFDRLIPVSPHFFAGAGRSTLSHPSSARSAAKSVNSGLAGKVP